MHKSEGGQNETSASKAGRIHSRQQGQSGDSDRLVMTSLTLDRPCLVGSWPDLPFFTGAPDSCTGAKANPVLGTSLSTPPASFPLVHANL